MEIKRLNEYTPSDTRKARETAKIIKDATIKVTNAMDTVFNACKSVDMNNLSEQDKTDTQEILNICEQLQQQCKTASEQLRELSINNGPSSHIYQLLEFTKECAQNISWLSDFLNYYLAHKVYNK